MRNKENQPQVNTNETDKEPSFLLIFTCEKLSSYFAEILSITLFLTTSIVQHVNLRHFNAGPPSRFKRGTVFATHSGSGIVSPY
jgi:hypothetical protein